MAALDATVAGPSANSYLTVAQADALAADDTGPERDGWVDPTVKTAKYEAVLKRATREIDAHVRTGWPKYEAAQLLLFPRSIDTAAGAAVIPVNIQWAAYCQAAYLLANAATIDRASARHARNQTQSTEPNLSSSQGEDPTAAVLSPRALQYLAGYGRRQSSSGSPIGSVRIASGFRS